MHFNKIITILIILTLANAGCSTIPIPTPKQAAVLDTATTIAVLSTGAGYEANPVGFVAATLGKALILSNIDRFNPETQEYIERATASLWTAAAVNNLGVLMCIPLSASLPLTLAAGYLVYKNTPRSKASKLVKPFKNND